MNIKAELASMERLTTCELAERYAALTGQPVRTRHRAYLIRKIAWRLQADAEGDLSERARRRAAGCPFGGNLKCLILNHLRPNPVAGEAQEGAQVVPRYHVED
jgi:hypothetical protein